MRQHKSLTVEFGGEKPPLNVFSFAKLDIEAPSLFMNFTPNVQPIAIKSRRYSAEDRAFIRKETERLLH